VDLIWQGILKALALLAKLDFEVLRITWLSLEVSGLAVLVCLLIGVPFGLLLGLTRFPGRQLLLTLVNTGMGLPPVVVGLFIAIILWRSGPLGWLELMYTPLAMIMAQVIIALPIVAGLTTAAIQQINPKLRLQALALGATRLQMLWTVLKEARLPTLAALMAGFGGVISEVGAVMMVGGNIKGETRVLTTATVMETRMGHFDVAIALSVILLVLTFAINYVLTFIQQRGDILWTKRIWR
jgi:tungstate transport system permease protein